MPRLPNSHRVFVLVLLPGGRLLVDASCSERVAAGDIVSKGCTDQRGADLPSIVKDDFFSIGEDPTMRPWHERVPVHMVQRRSGTADAADSVCCYQLTGTLTAPP